MATIKNQKIPNVEGDVEKLKPLRIFGGMGNDTAAMENSMILQKIKDRIDT
jgi:hypothetical protein